MKSGITIRQKLALEIFRQYKQNVTRVHPLNYILWECTLRCNLNCRHCGSDCHQNTSVPDMPVADFLSAIDTLGDSVNPHKTSIVFTGGEPLLRTDLEACGEELYKRGFPWGIVTNGCFLTPLRLDSLISSGMRAITISLDGMEESHVWLRRKPDSFKLAMNAINNVVNSDIVYDVVTCVNQHNFGELENMKELLIATGVKQWRLFSIFPIGRAKEDTELQLTPVQFVSFFEFLKQSRPDDRIKISYGCEGFLGRYEGKVRDSFFFCRAGINVISVLADGSISACPNLRENFIQGNIYHHNFAEVWETKFEKFRDRSWTKTDECADCKSYRYCQGNGLHLRDEKTGKLLFCHLKRLYDGDAFIQAKISE